MRQLEPDGGIPRHILLMMAVLAGFTVANLYYNQALLELISQGVDITQAEANLITVITQVGYALGLLFIVPMADMVSVRRITTLAMSVAAASALSIAYANNVWLIWGASLTLGQAVMWGRSLYQNIQRFILFQMTVNVVACLIVLVGAFLGTESPLTVTQMLWVNLIMDTFAAMALASLPPSERVMAQKPRNRKEFIINRPMWYNILGTGGLFFIILLALLFAFKYADVRSLCDLFHLEKGGGCTLSHYELSLFFTIFVMLQFWNLFNAKGFAAGCSTFILSRCKGFVLITSIIIIGQLLIINFGGQFFNVVPISLEDWLIITCSTFLVALIGEVFRFTRFLTTNPF